MKVLLLTNEYPPYIYGGAGVHAAYLARELSKLCKVEVRCFGDQKESRDSLSVRGFEVDSDGYVCPKELKSVLAAVRRGLDFNTAGIDADIVHVHTWYTHFGGILAKLNSSVPMVLTAHSLEPLRPWKREQLGGGYHFSSWVERQAMEMADSVVAVSHVMKEDILRAFRVDAGKIRVIYNGIDTEVFRPVKAPERIAKFGVDPEKPFVLFVGRVTRQKGIIHLVNAVRYMDPDYQVVLCAGMPDTEGMGESVYAAVASAQAERSGIFWVRTLDDEEDKVAFYSHASVFCCPSVYEPFGIINLEAMACGTPVVAGAVGGIPEVVVDRGTGFLVPMDLRYGNTIEPADPDRFSRDLAERINTLMADEELCSKMGRAGRRRAVEIFSWASIAHQTHTMYQSLL